MLLPIFVNLKDRPVLVVGGGPVAASKVAVLKPTGARITVVAPLVDAAIHASGVAVQERAFEEEDLDGVCFVVAAATPRINRQIADAAAPRHVLVNAVDDPVNASAFLASVIRRDGVTIAISTSGRAPALAALLREGLERLLPADLAVWMAEADRLKANWRAEATPMEERRPRLAEALLGLYGGKHTPEPVS